MSLARSPIVTVMTAAARKAARSLLHDFREVEQLQVSVKGTNDFVSEADIRAEKILARELGHARPDYGFLMEESGANGDPNAEFRWVVDPLDGTSNFLHALPYFCISIACEQRRPNGTYFPMAAVIYDPIHDDLFQAEYKRGAFHNDRRMQVSRREVLDNALFVTAAPRLGREGSAEAVKMYGNVATKSLGVRTMGATALDLAYVAAGPLRRLLLSPLPALGYFGRHSAGAGSRGPRYPDQRGCGYQRAQKPDGGQSADPQKTPCAARRVRLAFFAALRYCVFGLALRPTFRTSTVRRSRRSRATDETTTHSESGHRGTHS